MFNTDVFFAKFHVKFIYRNLLKSIEYVHFIENDQIFEKIKQLNEISGLRKKSNDLKKNYIVKTNVFSSK